MKSCHIEYVLCATFAFLFYYLAFSACSSIRQCYLGRRPPRDHHTIRCFAHFGNCFSVFRWLIQTTHIAICVLSGGGWGLVGIWWVFTFQIKSRPWSSSDATDWHHKQRDWLHLGTLASVDDFWIHDVWLMPNNFHIGRKLSQTNPPSSAHRKDI